MYSPCPDIYLRSRRRGGFPRKEHAATRRFVAVAAAGNREPDRKRGGTDDRPSLNSAHTIEAFSFAAIFLGLLRQPHTVQSASTRLDSSPGNLAVTRR